MRKVASIFVLFTFMLTLLIFNGNSPLMVYANPHNQTDYIGINVRPAEDEITYDEDGNIKVIKGLIHNLDYCIKGEKINIPPEIVQVPVPRDIMMLVDVSGSMNWDMDGNRGTTWSPIPLEERRIEIARKAAISFVNSMVELDQNGKYIKGNNVRIGWTEYGTVGTTKGGMYSLSNEVQYKQLISVINQMRPQEGQLGGTNMGDGIRVAYYNQMKSARPNAKKYFIHLTDGEPTLWTRSSAFSSYSINNDSALPITVDNSLDMPKRVKYFGGSGTDDNENWAYNWYYNYFGQLVRESYPRVIDPAGGSLDYAVDMGGKIAQADIESHLIAFGVFAVGQNENDTHTKFQTIATGSGCDVVNTQEGKSYHRADTALQLQEIYNQISLEAREQYAIGNVTLTHTFDKAISVLETEPGKQADFSVVYDSNTEKTTISQTFTDVTLKLVDDGTPGGPWYQINPCIDSSIQIQYNEKLVPISTIEPAKISFTDPFNNQFKVMESNQINVKVVIPVAGVMLDKSIINLSKGYNNNAVVTESLTAIVKSAYPGYEPDNKKVHWVLKDTKGQIIEPNNAIIELKPHPDDPDNTLKRIVSTKKGDGIIIVEAYSDELGEDATEVEKNALSSSCKVITIVIDIS